MRYCLYCGMPMEDDDRFCTRCGKAVVQEETEASHREDPETSLGLDEETVTGTVSVSGPETECGAGIAAGKGAQRSARRSVRPEMSAENSCKKPRSSSGHSSERRSGNSSMYGDPHVDSAAEMSGKNRSGIVDPSRYIMVAAAAVLLLVLGTLLFMLVKPSTKKKADTEDNPIAVYDQNSGQESNLNQGQQNPEAGQAVDNKEQGGRNVPSDGGNDAGSGSQNAGQSSGKNTDASASDVKESSSSSKEKEQPEEQDADSGGTEPEDNESSESGWVIDEDGNEVYYPGDDEAYTDNNQTEVGGDGKKSDPEPVETRSHSEEEPAPEDSPSSEEESSSGNDSLAGDNVTKDDSYILAESNRRYYTREELEPLDDYTLQMAINELYARHGRKFETESIRRYFESKSWYHGTIEPADFDANESRYFNTYEIGNRELMSRIRNERQEPSGTTSRH